MPEGGGDEIGVLARTFNRMVAGLREGLLYQDLFGRAVAPEVRDQLTRSMAGDREAVRARVLRATILFVGLQQTSRWEEEEDAGRGIETLNAFLAGALPRIAQHGGVVDRFDGEELLAFFGILPRALPPAVSALQATHAGLELLDLIRDLNDGGGAGLRPLHISIGVDTGRVVAGGLGTRERLQYTLIGDTVSLAEQIGEVARGPGGKSHAHQRGHPPRAGHRPGALRLWPLRPDPTQRPD